jgi:hypothetical protein
MNGVSDSYFVSVEATGNTGANWNITNCGNCRWVGCKGENSGTGQGWYLTAASGFTGELAFSGCTSQLNHLDGWYLTGPGAGLYQFTGCRSVGDGASSGSAFTVTGSFAGTVQLTGWGSVPGATTPATGLTISSVSSSAYIQVANSLLWGHTTAVSNDASAGAFLLDPNVVYRTGTTGSPTSAIQYPAAAESVHAAGSTGASPALNATTAAVQTATLNAATVTWAFTSPPAGAAWSVTLIQSQDATGGRAVVWPSSVQWQDGIAPTLTTTASATDILVFMTPNGGTTWYGQLAGVNYQVP